MPSERDVIMLSNKVLAEQGTPSSKSPRTRFLPPFIRLSSLAWLAIVAAVLVILAFL